MSLIFSIITIILIIILHEGGHFSMAKMLKVPVSEFSIGFGKALFSKQVNETQYSIRMIPFGGFCRFGDENDDVLARQPVYKRILICLAGSLSNILTALLVSFAMCIIIGVPVATLQVESIVNESVNTIQAGDVVQSVNGVEITTFSELTGALIKSASETANIVVDRNGELIEENIELIQLDGSYKLGLTFVGDYERASVGNAAIAGWNYFTSSISSVFNSLSLIAKHEVGLKDLSGIVGITTSMANAAKSSAYSLLSYFVLISANIGIFNLLPIPCLDGAKIIFAALSKVFNKEKLEKIETNLSTVMMLLLFGLFIVITIKDIAVSIGLFG